MSQAILHGIESPLGERIGRHPGLDDEAQVFLGADPYIVPGRGPRIGDEFALFHGVDAGPDRLGSGRG